MNTLKQLLLAAALAVAATAIGADPEPDSGFKAETAVPSIDPTKAKTDGELAARAATHLAISKKNLARIGIALHDHYSAKNLLPVNLQGKGGIPLLSWRVAILPHIGEEKLYKQFKLDEDWTSPHNRKLIEKMPDVYSSPRVKQKAKGLTVYQTFTGPDAVFGRGRTLGLGSITDGTSNTIFAVESGTAVPWTKPVDLFFSRKKAVPDIGKAYGKKPLAVMFDGSPRLLNLEKIKEETLKNAIDPVDGNALGKDWKEGAEG